VRSIANKTPEGGVIYVTAGETISLATLGLNDELKIDTGAEQSGAQIFVSIETEKGQIRVGTETPDELRIGNFSSAQPQADTPFNTRRYVLTKQGLGRAWIYYPPGINTPKLPLAEADPCCVDPCGRDCPDPCGEHDCGDKPVELTDIDDTITISLHEKGTNGDPDILLETMTKAVKIHPHIPRVTKLEIVGFKAASEDPIRERMKDETAGEMYNPDDFDDIDGDGSVDVPIDGVYQAAKDGIMGMTTAGVGGGKFVIHALTEDAASSTGMMIDKGANGIVKLELLDYDGEVEIPEVEMLNGQAIVELPAELTKAGGYCVKAKLMLPLNGDPDPISSLALPREISSTDLYTKDHLIIKDTGVASKLALKSLKSIISDDATPLQDANGVPLIQPEIIQAGNNASTAIKVYAMDEFGNKTDFPKDAPNKAVTVVDAAGIVDGSTLKLSFDGQMEDMLGDTAGEVVRPGEASLVASIEGDASIQASDPLMIKVVGRNLIAQRYQGADAPYNGAVFAGQVFKAFSIAVDGGNPTNGIPDGAYNGTPDVIGADDAVVSDTGPAKMVVKTYQEGSWEAVEEVEFTLGQSGTMLEALFTKAVMADPDPDMPGKSYFLISDKLGNYGQVKVELPDDIKPASPKQMMLVDASCQEATEMGDTAGKTCCELRDEETETPTIVLEPWFDSTDDTYKVVIPENRLKMVDEYGNAITPPTGTFAASSSNAIPALTVIDEMGQPVTPEGSGHTDGMLMPGQGMAKDCGTEGQADAYVLSYKTEGEGKFAGEDSIVLTSTKAGVEPRTVKVVIPPKPTLTTLQVELESVTSPNSGTLPVNSEVALTVRALDQNGLPVNALCEATMTFSGDLSSTATLWRHEDETLETDLNGNGVKWLPTKLLNSGDIISPQCIDSQLMVLNIGSETGTFTLTFSHPDLEETQSVTIEAVPSYIDDKCSSINLTACTTEDDCNLAGGIFENGQCNPVLGPTECELKGGIFSIVRNKCYEVQDQEVDLLDAASSDDPNYGGPQDDEAKFSGGLLNFTKGPDEFEAGSASSPVIVSLNDKVLVSGVIKLQPGDEGKKADIVAAGVHTSAIYHENPDSSIPGGAAWYMLADCKTEQDCPAVGWEVKLWLHDDAGYPVISELEPFEPDVILPETGRKTVHMYTGNFVYTGPLEIYFGYVITEPGDVDFGKVVFNMEPIYVEITE
jgi:hypothetical protein